jgi:hypothetical protein
VRSVLVACLLAAGVAHADEATSVHESSLLDKGTDPLLHIDPIALPSGAGLGRVEDVHERTMMQLGDHTWAELEGVHWTNQEVDRRFTSDLSTPERGWTASLRLSHDFGPFEASVLGRVGELESQQSQLAARMDEDHRKYKPARYYEVGVTIGKAKKLSRWKTAWIALTLGRRAWIGQPPTGEKDASQVMLSIGTTFK